MPPSSLVPQKPPELGLQQDKFFCKSGETVGFESRCLLQLAFPTLQLQVFSNPIFFQLAIPSYPYNINLKAMISNTKSPKRYKLVAPKPVESVESNGNNDILRDPFEDLCDELICHILTFLPMKNIGQLSLLSHHWLHLWSIYPYLDFLKVKAPTSHLQLPMPQRRVMLEKYTESIIRSSFSRRPLCDTGCSASSTSKINTFYLGGYLGYNGFNQCIYHALAHDVEDLKLQISFTGCYNLPAKLFACKAMRSLELKVIPESTPSSTFSGSFIFPIGYMVAWINKDVGPYLRSQLRNLYLDHVTFPSYTFPSDIDFFSESYFPYLTRLSLSNCDGVDFLEVSCPNLVYLHINKTEMEKFVLKTSELRTLYVLQCFTIENEGITSVDIWAPRLEVFQWAGNVVPSRFYVQAPTHVINFELSFLSLDVEETMLESAANLLSLCCMTTNFGMGDHPLTVLGKLDSYGIHTRFCMSLSELTLVTAMTKKPILGIWFLLRASSALRFLNVHIMRDSYAEGTHNWGRASLDNLNISEAEFWVLQSQYQTPILLKVEKVKVLIQTDVELRDIRFVNFLLQRCRGVRCFDMIISPTVSNEALLKRFRLEIGDSASKIASPDVVQFVARNGTAVFRLSIARPDVVD